MSYRRCFIRDIVVISSSIVQSALVERERPPFIRLRIVSKSVGSGVGLQPRKAKFLL